MTADPQTVDVTEPPSIGKEFFTQQFPIFAAIYGLPMYVLVRGQDPAVPPRAFPQGHAWRDYGCRRNPLCRRLFLYPAVPHLGSRSMKHFHRVVPYLPFIVLAAAVVVAVYHIRVYW